MASIEELVPGAICAPPARPEELQGVEAKLGVKLPLPLRTLYLQADGFREPLGNAAYLFSLEEMASLTEYYWQGWPLDSPQGHDFTGYIVFGSSGSDEHWAMQIAAPHQVIGYHHHMEGTPEELGYDLDAVFMRDFAIMRDFANSQPE